MSEHLAPSRRAVVRTGLLMPVAVAVAGPAACTTGGAVPEAPPAPHPDVVLADEAAERERRLLAAYDHALTLAPALADRLTALRGEHAAHLAALGAPEPTAGPSGGPEPGGGPDPDGGPEPGGTEESASAGVDGPTAAPASPSPLPADPPALLAALADLERETAVLHGAAAVGCGRGLAVVLASAAASEASHTVVLR